MCEDKGRVVGISYIASPNAKSGNYAPFESIRMLEDDGWRGAAVEGFNPSFMDHRLINPTQRSMLSALYRENFCGRYKPEKYGQMVHYRKFNASQRQT